MRYVALVYGGLVAVCVLAAVVLGLAGSVLDTYNAFRAPAQCVRGG